MIKYSNYCFRIARFKTCYIQDLLHSRIASKTKMVIRKTNKKKQLMQGGRYLGEGAFGCVVTPAIECSSKGQMTRLTKKTKTSNLESKSKREPVSKLIRYADEQTNTEIDVANILKKLDPQQKYFLYIKQNCNIRKIPQNRSNIASVRYLDNELSYYRKLENKKLDKNYCDIDLSMKPVNLIMSDGGYDFKSILEVYDDGNKYKSSNEYKICEIFFNDFKNQFYYLLTGLQKLHQVRIVNRDIKKENLMIDWDNEEQTKARIKYIDFGLSEILTSKYCSSIHNIHAQGTPELISPEIFIASILRDYSNYNQEYILKKISREMNDSVIKMFKDLQIDYSDLEATNKKILFDMLDDFKKKIILPKYFGTNTNKLNGYVQKTDVYALGLTIYEVIHIYCKDKRLKNNIKLKNLLKNMIALDPGKRYNVLDCLKHPYFS